MNHELTVAPNTKMKVRRDANGVHFFDRHTGLNVLLHEMRVSKPEQAWAPRFMSIALTNACDLSCRFCYAPKHVATLDQEDVITWAIELDRGGCLGVGFGGGEPTLHRHFISLCKRVSMSTKLAVSFTTHGHRLSVRMAERLAGYVHFVRVSMDGTFYTYTQIRGRQFTELVKKLKLIRQIAPFGVNYVVNSTTIDELDVAAALAFEHGAQELLLLPERPTRATKGVDEYTLDTLRDWINRNSHYRLAISDSPPMEGIAIADPFHDSDGLTDYAHIDASGYLKESSYSPEYVKMTCDARIALDQLRRKLGALT